MKISSNIVSYLLIGLFLNGLAACATAPHQQAGGVTGSALYVLPERAFSVDRLNAAMDSLLSDNPSRDNIIVYVHGRACGGGGEPQKSLNEVMPELESNYTAEAIMFYWPGSDDECPLGFPEERARSAAPALGKALRQLDQYKKANPEKLRNVKLTLLLHSMGNIVFEAFLQSHPAQALDAGLFDTVILNSSATAAKDHENWLKRLDFSPYVYVTVNDNDKILGGAGMAQHGTRLGKKLEAGFFDRPVKLAANAIYLDVSDTGVNHRYFIRSGQVRNPYLRQFYEAILNGRDFNFTGFEGVKKAEKRDGTTIFFIRN